MGRSLLWLLAVQSEVSLLREAIVSPWSSSTAPEHIGCSANTTVDMIQELDLNTPSAQIPYEMHSAYDSAGLSCLLEKRVCELGESCW